jgi:hypothetical protein
MSVWPYASETHSPSLETSEGELISISITVEPRDLEALLEALAALDFPINPQIYHEAAVIYVERDGSERLEPLTIVEFPAYASGLRQIRTILEAYGFTGEAVSVAPMLAEIHAGEHLEPAPPGANYAYRILRKHATAAASGTH